MIGKAVLAVLRLQPWSMSAKPGHVRELQVRDHAVAAPRLARAARASSPVPAAVWMLDVLADELSSDDALPWEALSWHIDQERGA